MSYADIEDILYTEGLNFASKKQRIEALGININKIQAREDSYLIKAIRSRSDEAVNMLLDLGADVHMVDKRSNNALMVSSLFTKYIKLETYKRLIAATQIVSEENIKNFRAYLDIIRESRDSNKYLHPEEYLGINAQNNQLYTVLSILASIGNRDVSNDNINVANLVIKELITLGANPNLNNIDNMSPLIIALVNGNTDFAITIANSSLLDINSPQENGERTYLILAIEIVQLELILVLLKNRLINVNQLTEDKNLTALMMAVKPDIDMTPVQRRTIVKLLLLAGANVNIYNKHNLSAYDIADVSTIGEELYDKLKPTVGPPTNANNSSTENNTSPINTTFINSIRNIQPSPLNTSKSLIVDSNIVVYDVYEAGEISLLINQIKEDRQNIYFKFAQSFFRVPRQNLENGMKDDFSNIIFSCTSPKAGALRITNINKEEPYYLIRGPGNYTVRLSQFSALLQQVDTNCFELISDGQLKYVGSFNSILRGSNFMNFSGREVNIVSADHCQEGSNRELFKLIPLALTVNTTGGRKGKNAKKTKKAKKAKTKYVKKTRRSSK